MSDFLSCNSCISWLKIPCALIAVIVSTAAPACGQFKAGECDWPGWRGAERTGVSHESGLLKEWPAGGPRLVWKATGLGEGYATPSVAAGRLFVMGSKDNDEFVMAYDVRDGHRLWSTRVGIVGENRGPNYPGPRSTPTVDGEWLYTLGSDGDLVCLAAGTGKLRWHKHLEKEFHGNRGTWAYAESPLIDGDKLVCTPGGPTALMLALDKHTGAVRWQTGGEDANRAGYASVIAVEAAGVKQYVQFIGSGVIGVAANDGRLLWKYKGNVGGQSCATPIFQDGCLFTSASGNEGAGGDALLRLVPDGSGARAEEVYLRRVLMSHHGGVLRLGAHLYGTNSSGLVCMDFKTGALKWRERCVGQGSLVAADGHLYVRGAQGSLALVQATSDGYHEKGRFRQPERSAFPAFTHPVVAGGRLYLRDADVLLSYDVKAP